jgi:hypothetical protein
MPGLISRNARVAILTKHESTIVSKLGQGKKEKKQALLALKL